MCVVACGGDGTIRVIPPSSHPDGAVVHDGCNAVVHRVAVANSNTHLFVGTDSGALRDGLKKARQELATAREQVASLTAQLTESKATIVKMRGAKNKALAALGLEAGMLEAAPEPNVAGNTTQPR